MATKSDKKTKFPTYKGKPFVRCGDEIYYGSMKDDFVVKLDIKTKKEVAGHEIADEISIALMRTDADISPRKQVVKTSTKQGMYLAMDIAEAWLERALEGKIDA